MKSLGILDCFRGIRRTDPKSPALRQKRSTEPRSGVERYGITELIADLEWLMEEPTRTKQELKDWYAEARAVQARIRDSEVVGALPETIWHFLIDADVRFKDPVYGETQLAQLREVIKRLRTGRI